MKDRSHPISPAGFEMLRTEWHDLKFVQRPAIQKQVGDAAAEGDRSENAAYTYGKMKLREIDRRLRRLDFLLDNARIIDGAKIPSDAVWFGARIRLRNLQNNREDAYQLVGSAESDPLQGRISLNSPLGMALKGKKVGDCLEVITPKGNKKLEILEIEYETSTGNANP